MKYIIGIDEVGRGPLAGPVVVAAVCVPEGWKPRRLRVGAPTKASELGKLKDSKKLSAKKREEWLEYFKGRPQVKFALARINPRGIEKWNISQAANRAAYNAVSKLVQCYTLNPMDYKLVCDGGLYPRARNFSLLSETIIKGDEKITAIKIASIFAKVQRDAYMVKLAKKYPQYGFEEHKGYATKKHRQAVKKYGPSKIHRLTFLGKYSKMKTI